MDRVTELIRESENIIFFTGAGVSTNCGLPDFRGEKGLYSYVEDRYSLPYPEAIFDIDYFKKDPLPFFDLSSELLNSKVNPSITHRFISWLEGLGKVSTVITQNIDMLHEKAGSKKVLSCHGTYENATCLTCKRDYYLKDIEEKLLNGDIPFCSCGGVIKPDITFFGEALPIGFYHFMENPPQADLVIIMGTSLNVQPAASLPLLFKDRCPIVLINRDKTAFDNCFDFIINTDCDKFSSIVWNNLKE